VCLELDDTLLLEILDDGVGITKAGHRDGGLGLLSMRERAQELGGACRIEPAPGGGTRVVASLPLPPETETDLT
jgi:signal transduction histidine kinase